MVRCNRKLLRQTAGALALVWSVAAYPAYPAAHLTEVSIDMDPGTAGIQDCVTLDLGTDPTGSCVLRTLGVPFTIDIVVDVGVGGLSAYGVSVRFDTDELSLSGAPAATEPMPAAAGIAFHISGAAPVETESIPLFLPAMNANIGEVLNFEAATFAAGPVDGTSFVAGSITVVVGADHLLDATDYLTLPSLGYADLTPGLFTGADGFIDNASATVMPLFNSGYVVPEPATLALLLIGGMVPLCRRRRQA